MDLKIILFICLLVFSMCKTEGFVYQKNLNESTKYPDKKQFYAISNHNKISLKDGTKKTLLGNTNYKMVDNAVVEPQHGPYSAFLDVNKFRSFDHFYHSPISDQSYNFDVSYDRQFDYEIIQAEDKNKDELLKKEEKNDDLIHNPNYLYAHPKNNSKILYSDEIQDIFLKIKGTYNRHTNNTHRGPGYH